MVGRTSKIAETEMPRSTALKPEQVPADSKPTLEMFTKNIGFTPNMMATFAGLRYSDMLKLILEAAQERIAAQRASVVAAPERCAVGER